MCKRVLACVLRACACACLCVGLRAHVCAWLSVRVHARARRAWRSYVRRVLEIVPVSVFEILYAIIKLQTEEIAVSLRLLLLDICGRSGAVAMQMLPTKLELAELKVVEAAVDPDVM